MTVKLPTLKSWTATFNRWRIEIVNALFLLADGLDKSTPVGMISPYAGIFGAPRGWLLANGDTVSRAQFKSLYNVIGDTYGAGDGITTFTLPDLRHRVPMGQESSVAAVDTLGETLGLTTAGTANPSALVINFIIKY